MDIQTSPVSPQSLESGAFQAQHCVVDLPLARGRREHLARVMTLRHPAVLFPDKAIPGWVARPAQP